MGLALNNMPEHGWKKLFALVEGSEKTVIEYSATFRKGKKQVKNITANTTKEITLAKDFDFSKEQELPTNYDKFTPYRTMFCLENV